MLIPSIDLMGGRIVQLVQGEKLRLAFDDFEYWIGKFSKFPLVQLIDLDAAMRQGDNAKLVEQIAKRLPVQAGGGIHTIDRARQVLDAGAQRVIIGSALFTAEGTVNTSFAAELASAIGSDRIVAGIDTKNGHIAVKGWKAQVALTPDEAIPHSNPVSRLFSTHTSTQKEPCGASPSKPPRACASSPNGSSSSPEAFAASRKSTLSMPLAPTRWLAWRCTPNCWPFDSGYLPFSHRDNRREQRPAPLPLSSH